MYYIKQIYLQLENALQFRLGRIKRIEDFFIVEINDGLKMSRTLNKYIIVLDYADKTCAALVLQFSHSILSLVLLLG